MRRCLGSVLAGGGLDHEVVVVDDCSPEPALSAWLAGLASEGRITLLRNERNRGFVGSVNRALALHPERDVVLLNSDTEVAGDWLARIARCASAHPDAGTITPFSNNATICSYPYEGWTGEVPGTLGLAALDALFARTLPGVVADLPTGVGFCMFVRRACVAQIGALDEAAFGRGYGEENDLCRRAAKAGWRNLLCADVFVYHKGGVSFGPGREALMAAGAAALRRLHPDYDRVVRDFIAADPLRPLRAAIDAARTAQGDDEAAALDAERAAEPVRGAMPPLPPAPPLHSYAGMEDWPTSGRCDVSADALPVWLHLLHGWGGGTERWVHDMAGADVQARHLCLRSRTGRNDAGVRLELLEPAVSDEVLLAWDLAQPVDFCAPRHAPWRAVFDEVLGACDVKVVVVSSLIGHSLEAFESGRPTVVVLHDLFPFCPALFGWFGEACEVCDASRLVRCFAENPMNVFWHQAAPQAWMDVREVFARALVGPGVVVTAPSQSVFERYRTLLPALAAVRWHKVPHGLALCPPPLSNAAAVKRGTPRLRVVVPGRLAPHKGLALVQALLPELTDFADVLLLGCGEFGTAFAHLPHVRIVTDYRPAQLAAHVAAFGAECALLPAVLPESFSYTLSEMQALAIPVVATDLGAFAERIEEGVTGWRVPPNASAILEMLRTLAAEPQRLDAASAVLRGRPTRTAAQMVADYRALPGVAEAERVPARGSGLLWRAFSGLHEARSWLGFRMREIEALHRAWRAGDAGLKGYIASLEVALATEREQADSLRRRLSEVEEQVAAVCASTSWRLTAPLRRVAIALRGRRGRSRPGGRSLAPTPVVGVAPAASRAAQAWQPAGDWQGRWAVALGEGEEAARLRAELRVACREALGLPDSTCLVIGMGRGDARSGLADFARVAEGLPRRAMASLSLARGARCSVGRGHGGCLARADSRAAPVRARGCGLRALDAGRRSVPRVSRCGRR
ncbi:glycosyltransferase [Thauera humireducens]|uniref:glycosyltransferase n=1 Tax=Thauera humireducens TaxID=1134435 RepID=UPI00311DA37F